MMKTNILLATLLLGSCAERHTMAETYDLADVANANARRALARIGELSDRVEQLERRLR